MGNTTNFNLPYPDEDALIDVAGDIQRLAEAVDELQIGGDADCDPYAWYPLTAELTGIKYQNGLSFRQYRAKENYLEFVYDNPNKPHSWIRDRWDKDTFLKIDETVFSIPNPTSKTTSWWGGLTGENGVYWAYRTDRILDTSINYQEDLVSWQEDGTFIADSYETNPVDEGPTEYSMSERWVAASQQGYLTTSNQNNNVQIFDKYALFTKTDIVTGHQFTNSTGSVSTLSQFKQQYFRFYNLETGEWYPILQSPKSWIPDLNPNDPRNNAIFGYYGVNFPYVAVDSHINGQNSQPSIGLFDLGRKIININSIQWYNIPGNPETAIGQPVANRLFYNIETGQGHIYAPRPFGTYDNNDPQRQNCNVVRAKTAYIQDTVDKYWYNNDYRDKSLYVNGTDKWWTIDPDQPSGVAQWTETTETTADWDFDTFYTDLIGEHGQRPQNQELSRTYNLPSVGVENYSTQTNRDSEYYLGETMTDPKGTWPYKWYVNDSQASIYASSNHSGIVYDEMGYPSALFDCPEEVVPSPPTGASWAVALRTTDPFDRDFYWYSHPQNGIYKVKRWDASDPDAPQKPFRPPSQFQGLKVPVGTITHWYGVQPPSGWLICDGSDFSTIDYPELEAHLGSFSTPNFIDRLPLSTSGSTFDYGGSEYITEDHLPTHTHTVDEGSIKDWKAMTITYSVTSYFNVPPEQESDPPFTTWNSQPGVDTEGTGFTTPTQYTADASLNASPVDIGAKHSHTLADTGKGERFWPKHVKTMYIIKAVVDA